MDTIVKLLKAEGIEIDLARLPLDDTKTYELLSSGNTSGVFQLESRGMRDLLTKLRPSQFDDIMPLIALYRPGPLKSGMVDEFIKRRNNPSLVAYETPKLKEILHDTYGVIIYQEQIMKIASVLAGFSMKDADALRKAMSKKIPEQLERSTSSSSSTGPWRTTSRRTWRRRSTTSSSVSGNMASTSPTARPTGT